MFVDILQSKLIDVAVRCDRVLLSNLRGLDMEYRKMQFSAPVKITWRIRRQGGNPADYTYKGLRVYLGSDTYGLIREFEGKLYIRKILEPEIYVFENPVSVSLVPDALMQDARHALHKNAGIMENHVESFREVMAEY